MPAIYSLWLVGRNGGLLYSRVSSPRSVNHRLQTHPPPWLRYCGCIEHLPFPVICRTSCRCHPSSLTTSCGWPAAGEPPPASAPPPPRPLPSPLLPPAGKASGAHECQLAGGLTLCPCDGLQVWHVRHRSTTITGARQQRHPGAGVHARLHRHAACVCSYALLSSGPSACCPCSLPPCS